MKGHSMFASTSFQLRSRIVGCGLVLAAVSWGGIARAAEPTAETLYQDGRRAAQAKNWELACKLFRESQEREPAPGTLLNLADCEENLGSLLAARAHFESAARSFRAGDERGPYAKERLAALEARIPKLTVRLSPKAPANTVVERDGLALGPTILGVAASMEPGEHTLVVRVPGQPEERVTIRLAPSEVRDVEVPSNLSTTPASPAPAASLRAKPSEKPSSSKPLPLRPIAWGALGVGAAGVIVGAVGGVLTLGAKSSADDNCGAAGCNAEGLSAQDRGKTWSTVSTVGFIVGGVGLAAGAGLLLYSSKHGAVSAQPVAGGSELRWVGHF
ncbi:MAG TPA: hypothetical protein VM925_28665 [Labilithrix sp.]|nr:hypothetical protein [Labilithrix sp.]